MPTIPQRIASTFAVLFGQYGDVTAMAREREQSRHSLYREAEHVLTAVDGTATQARINALEQQVAQLQAQVQDLQGRLQHSVEMTPEKQAEMACVAQAEGVSLSVARRLLQVVMAPKSRSVPALGRATRAAGQRAGQWLAVRDETVQPEVEQGAADAIFWAEDRS